MSRTTILRTGRGAINFRHGHRRKVDRSPVCLGFARRRVTSFGDTRVKTCRGPRIGAATGSSRAPSSYGRPEPIGSTTACASSEAKAGGPQRNWRLERPCARAQVRRAGGRTSDVNCTVRPVAWWRCPILAHGSNEESACRRPSRCTGGSSGKFWRSRASLRRLRHKPPACLGSPR